MQKYTITRNLPNFCVHIFALPAFSLSFSIKILISYRVICLFRQQRDFFKTTKFFKRQQRLQGQHKQHSRTLVPNKCCFRCPCCRKKVQAGRTEGRYVLENSEAVVACLVRGIACKAILSEAVVTRDTVPGLKQYENCLKDSTLLCRN